MSSFQLWDLKKSPHISIIGTLEPDHLNVHKDYDDYLNAKSNITKYQTKNDTLIYYKDNPDTVKLAETSKAKKIAFPFEIPALFKESLTIPGEHNLNNFIAALSAVAAYLNISPDEYLRDYQIEVLEGLRNFRGLPHRLEYLRELNGVKYYDDNFSTNPSSTRVAVNSFPNENVVIIVGGRDKTGNEDLPEIYEILKSPQIKAIILMGESGHALAEKYQDDRFIIAESLAEAVSSARQAAENLAPSILLMSPSAASFDMFENVYDRGDQFKRLIEKL